MAYGFSWGFATSYTQLRDLIAEKIEAAGWVEQGSTSIFKSPAADEQGNYAYVLVTDDGISKPKLECSTRLNTAGTALLLPLERISEVNNWPKMWHFYIYDKWFYCFEIDLPSNTVDAYLGAGLFRPFPSTEFWNNPCWVFSGNGSESGIWVSYSTTSTLLSKAGRVRLPSGRIWYCGPGLSKSIVNPMTYQAHLGGLFIQPCTLYIPLTEPSIIGTLYNTIMVGGMGWNTSEILFPANSLITYGGDRIFMIPFRINLHQPPIAYTGISPAFQIDGFE